VGEKRHISSHLERSESRDEKSASRMSASGYKEGRGKIQPEKITPSYQGQGHSSAGKKERADSLFKKGKKNGR